MDLTPIPTGNDVHVNTFTTNQQFYPAVAALAGGGFVVTWTSNGQDGSGYGIYCQRYAADGTAVGSEFRVNTTTTEGQWLPSVTALAGGGFVVTWTSQAVNAGPFDIYGQRYTADGTAVGSEFRVNTYTTDWQMYPSVTGLADGGFVVTWSSDGQDGSDWGTYGQRYAADGTAVGSEFRVNTYTTDFQVLPSVAALAGGGFVVTWTSTQDGARTAGVYGQRYETDGTAEGSEFRVNTGTATSQWSSVAALAGGGFVVTWQSHHHQDGSGTGIYGQRYAADGTAVGSEFRVNSFTTNDQTFPSVTAIAGGGFVVTWSSLGQDGSGYGIYGQRYAADGTAVGSEFRINQITTGDQLARTEYGSETVAALADGRLVQIWSGNGDDEVFFRLINVPNIVLDDAATTTEDTPVNIQVLANDGGFEGTPAIIGTTNGAHGTVAVNNNGTPGNTADDFVVYTPTPDFNGTDSFTYTLNGGSTATVTVTVTPAADILNDMATTNEDTPVNILVQANDTFESTPAITGTTNGAHGTVAVNNNGTPGNTADDFVVYTPAPDFNGADTFTYTVTSGGDTETGTVSVTVAAVADIVNDSVTNAQDSGAHNLDLLANDTFENPGRSITSVGAAAHGTTSINNNGTAGNTADDFVVYTSAGGYSGPDTFTYTVTSGGVTETATVSVTVTATPPPPSTTPTAGNDDITGTDGADTIASLSGEDTVRGLGGNDVLFGNPGRDTVLGGLGDDTVYGGVDSDLVQGNEGNDLLFGNEGSDSIDGGDGNNTIVGGQDSSDAADSITAGSGPDLIWGNGGADTITADGGGNTVIGGFGSDSIVTGSADDIIFGNEDSDTISGGDGANLIFGGFGDDSILTGSGNDTIWGNENNDTMAGGAGADRYVFLVGSGNDQINGFSGSAEVDRLDLSGQTFTTGTSADGDVLLTLSGGGTIELNGVAPANFSPGFVL